MHLDCIYKPVHAATRPGNLDLDQLWRYLPSGAATSKRGKKMPYLKMVVQIDRVGRYDSVEEGRCF